MLRAGKCVLSRFPKIKPMYRDQIMSNQFDLKSLPLCGARTRSGRPCRHPGTKRNGRCRRHGGLSTGPKTVEGRARSSQNALKHGDFTADKRLARKKISVTLRKCRHQVKSGGNTDDTTTDQMLDLLEDHAGLFSLSQLLCISGIYSSQVRRRINAVRNGKDQRDIRLKEMT